jgi:hypothetical protein
MFDKLEDWIKLIFSSMFFRYQDFKLETRWAEHFAIVHHARMQL